MSYPSAPNISYSYSGFQQSQGDNAFPGTELDADLANIVEYASTTINFLKLLARSDGVINVSALPQAADLTAYTAQSAQSAMDALASKNAAAASATNAATSAANAASSASSASASAASAVAALSTTLAKANNLSDVADAPTARTNLGLGSFSTKSSLVLADVGANFFTADATGRGKFASGFIDFSMLPAGTVLQSVESSSGAVATGTTVIPADDTIPQNTEGDQYLSVTITPTSATSVLEVDTMLQITNSASSGYLAVAIFRDSIVNALATGWQTFINTGFGYQVRAKVRVTAGSTAATTFKVRGGAGAAGTTTVNGMAAARLFGGNLVSFIRVTEIKA